ncbi:LacI family DNA-binding transcriptional regulator [Amnibacterium kyonggiense]|uniref:LacI family DNA-binding transcriptional regulator n=1 Tax=Amnibacterium kyonggiense TaxID=595671 RepID=UPI0013C30587|nr:LacI family DNA-binding transcriptional regulator [Amnibacterium kyonggiense]
MARLAGVSEATVSRALRDLRHVAPETVEAVREAADRLGFVPSRNAAALATGRPKVVGVVTPLLTGWFYAAVLEGVDAALRRAGWATSLVNLAEPGGARRRLTAAELRAGQASAHVVIGFGLDADEQQVLRDVRAPLVSVGGRFAGVRGISIPEADAARLAVGHLLALGHRRIAHVGAVLDPGVLESVLGARREAWTTMLAEAGVAAPSWWFASGGLSIDGSRAAALQLLARPDRPTAVFAATDETAFGVLLAAQRLGLRVPEDLSVAGLDDHPYSAGYGLTTVRQSPAEQGARAADLLLADLGARRGAVSTAPAPVELVVRSSTAPPAA